MAKIKLGNKPETFKPVPVKFDMPDGNEGAIKATFRYRTRSEFGELLNEVFAEAGEKPPAGQEVDFKALFQKAGTKNAEHLHKALAAWDLDEELSLDNLKALADELPAASAALMTAYAACCTEGRVKN